ncbi:MAG: exo-alpha-sialidase [SAR202 cluster bacterium]|nr:exo-alpha-sialidase [SAR202 cluster bacterium]
MSNVPMTRPWEMLAEHKTNYFHDSTFIEISNGRILHCSGKQFCTSDDGGISWSAPYQSRDKNGDVIGGGGTSLVKLDGNTIGLAAIRRGKGPDFPDWMERHSYMVYWRSDDEGKTWEKPVRMSLPALGQVVAYQDVFIRTSTGRIMLPIYTGLGHELHPLDQHYPHHGKLVNGQWVSTSAHFFGTGIAGSYVVYSDDEGRTWQQNKDGHLIIYIDWAASLSATSEPTIAEVAPGRIVMYQRTKLGRIFQSWSYDNGETWTSPVPTSLAATTTPAQIRKIPSTGHMLVVWNQESEDEIRAGYNRTRISSAISRNGGSVWEFYQNVHSMHDETRVEPGPIRAVRPEEMHNKPGQAPPTRDGKYLKIVDHHIRISYPSVFVMKDRVLIAHTYTHYEDHPTRAQLVKVGGADNKDFNQILKVLPLTWFYGGKEPADNPAFPKASDIAVPFP